MKHLIFILLLLPMFALTQQIKVNTFDKFIKQRRIETTPVTLISTSQAKVMATYKGIGDDLFIVLNGYGWGVATINENDATIFLLSNDSTVKVQSSGMQTYQIHNNASHYSHQYRLQKKDIEMLSRKEVTGIRKYAMQEYTEAPLAPKLAIDLKGLSVLFLQEINTHKSL